MKVLTDFYLKYQLFIKPLLVSIFCVTVIYLVLIPQIGAFTSTNGNLASSQTKLGILQVKASELDSLDKELYIKNLQLVLTALPEDRQVAQALVVVQDTLNRDGLVLENAKLLSGAGDKNQRSYQLQLVVRGDISKVRQFLLDLKKAPRLVQILDVNSQTGTSGLEIESQLTLEIFYGPLPKTLGEIDQPIPKLTDNDQQVIANIAKAVQTTGALGSLESSSSSSLGKADPFN